LTDQNGKQLAKREQAVSNSKADKRFKCKNTGGWDEGYWKVAVSADVDSSVTKVTVKITNTLNQGNKDESIGYGDMIMD
jgi:hypothetical protein